MGGCDSALRVARYPATHTSAAPMQACTPWPKPSDRNGLRSMSKNWTLNPADSFTAPAFWIKMILIVFAGLSLWALGKREEAIESYEKASACNHPRALSKLAISRLSVADWARTDELAGALRAHIAEGSFVDETSFDDGAVHRAEIVG